MKVFEYVDHRGQGVFTEWHRRLQSRVRAAFDVKLEAVRRAGEPGDQRHGELPPNLFRGPVKHRGVFYANTYKLTVNADGAWRPLACKGPIDINDEWTILVPVQEIGGKYPTGCFDEAEARRLEVIKDPTQRRRLLNSDTDD